MHTDDIGMAEFAGLTHLLAQQAERLGVNSADQSENLISSAASPSALDAVAAGEPLTDREAFPAGSRLCLNRADQPRIARGRSDAGTGRPIHYRLNTHCLPPPRRRDIDERKMGSRRSFSSGPV
jgi:hypothetical protein